MKEKKMKKNFLKIAAMLIAAMLLVVSCSQEIAPKSENDGLVEARLNVAYGRDLLVKDDSKAEDFYLVYTTEYQWTDGTPQNGYTEGVEGAKTAKLEPDGKLGWLTPGYWKITVNAYEGDGNGGKKGDKVIFTGNTSAYFTSKIATATIFLEPDKADNNSIEFDFYMQDLGAYDTDFVVKYSISKNGSTTEHNNVQFNKTEDDATNEVFAVNDGKGHQSEYKKTISNLASGYYTVTVSVYEISEKGEALKGGISKGMLLAGNNAKVEGHIEPADYVVGNVKTYFVDVDTKLEKVGEGFTLNEEGTVATIKLNFTDETDVDKYSTSLKDTDFDRTYVWTVDGDGSKLSQQTSNDITIGTSKDIIINNITTPGVKNITCTTIYSKKEGSDTYFWADTQSVQVKVTGIVYR